MTVNFNNWKVTATYKGDKCWDCSDGSRENWNNHKVTVTNTENGKRTSFDFWASIMNPELETEYDILNAFRCFVDDCLVGTETFHEFCGDFGYDEDSRKAEKVWKACQRATKKLCRIYDGDLYDLLDSLEQYA